MRGDHHVSGRASARTPPSTPRRPSIVVTPTSVSGGDKWHRGSALVVVPKHTVQVPSSIKQAEASPFRDEWREARFREVSRLQETWDLVDLPPGANVLGSKWVFALKTKPDGSIDRHKARLVCQGFGQKEGVDYDETYAATAGKTTIRLVLALVCVLNWKVKQLDVTGAFLYGKADRPIYVKQPPGHDDGTGRVCKLKRALYGLKQAPRIWQETLLTSLQGLGFTQATMDPSLYILKLDGEVVFLVDFVDDMLIISRSDPPIEWVTAELRKQYDITDMGEAQKYIGLYILRDVSAGEMWVHLAPYIRESGERFGIKADSFPDTPLPSDFVLFHPWEEAGEESLADSKGKDDPLLTTKEEQRYRSIVGTLNYVAHSVRLDVAYAANQLSHAQSAPRKRHLAAAERCIKYLLGTADLCLHFSKRSGVFLECFVDANYSSSGGKKSITGFILKVGGAPIMWTARKQDRVTTSTCDAEAYAIMTAVQYVEHARDLLEELGQTQFTPTPVYNDNTASVKLCIDPLSHKKSVQLTRQMAYVRERIKSGVIAPLHVRTTEQPADFHTKDAVSHQRCVEQSGMCLLPASTTST